MDMKMMAMTNSTVSAGQGTSTDSVGSAADKTGAGLFAGVLQTAVGTDGGDTSSNTDGGATAIGEELLAAMAQMPQSLQLLLNQLQGDAGGEPTLLVKLLSALNNDPKLADTLLDDKDMRAWLQDASALLAALAPNTQPLAPGAVNLSPSEWKASGSQNTDALKLQQTLLTLATMLEQQPNAPLLGHLAAELQKVLAPHMEKLNADLQSAATAQTAAVTDIAAAGANKANHSAVQVQAQKQDAQPQFTDGKPASGSTEQKSAAFSVQIAAVSKLAMLSAKGSVAAAALTGGSQTEALTSKSTATDAVDGSQNWLPGMPLHLAFKAQQLVESLKAPVATLSAANFSEEMGQLFVKSMKVSLLSNGVSEATLSLQPQNLGNVDVKLTMQNGHLIAHIATQTAAAKEMLESQLPQLRMMLQNQGLHVEKLEVTQNSHASSSMFHDQGTRGQSFGHEQSGSRNGSNSSGNLGFDDTVTAVDAVVSKEQFHLNGYGGSFVASA